MARPSQFPIQDKVLQEVRPGVWRLEPSGKMQVGVCLIASPKILQGLRDDRSLEQAVNVATLPGVVDPVLVMPDVHQGYGFPIGGVAAFREKSGVVSPGGVGYDINCGVRLLATSLSKEQIGDREARSLAQKLFEAVPAGVGSQRKDLRYSLTELSDTLLQGAKWAIRQGFGNPDDAQYIEEGGALPGADPEAVSSRAKERGHSQLGTLGSGNHFIEVQYVDEIFDETVAEAFGIRRNGIIVSIHTGSRGLGYQVCSDYLELALGAAKKYDFFLADRELAAMPLNSDEGKTYLKAMAAAANFAFANRQVITHWVRQVFRELFGEVEIPLVYDVCHNIAKFEEFPIAHGHDVRLCVHRKGATRAYPPGHPLVPAQYRRFGQPILIPGDMGRSSYVLAGQKGSMETSFGSACHGAGRELSRTAAKKLSAGRSIEKELEDAGIHVRSAGRNTVREEMPEAYKDVTDVVQATAASGIAHIVARLRPISVIKG